ncbi:protease modulator HflK [Novosphingopyxis sp. YJ-S2-01]|uniref:protease modulator HflK n=1 Tax=Novosphingopyxis sp. YJ-S2-01 TaxID=2794021 RepID=UPI0018DC6E7C|nr:protease modulator HflK [Novosphingopyxis sp. YJ-S2-01]MBH9536186.1 protease modulator HflK [Novosphingopyxis sp. YJ-S2-01]
MNDQGPWGGPRKGGSDGGNGSGDGGGDGPRNPWSPPPQGPGGGGPRKGRGPSLEDLLKNRGRFNVPGGPANKSIWLLAVVALVALWLAFSSIHVLGAEEEGVITRLGAYDRTVGPGVQFTLPAPIEKLQKVDTQAIRTTQIGSTGASQENLILTSDQNIIDMAYEVRWSVRNPARYLFQLEDPAQTVAEVGESAMRAAVANFDLISAIGPGRGEIEAQVRERMQQILDSYGAGITIEAISILQSDPPAEVNEAFKEVNAAKQERESAINNSRAFAQRVIERALGDTARFDKVYAEYRLAPEVTRRRIYYETMEGVLGDVDKTIVDTDGSVTPYLPLPEIRKRAEQPAAGAEASNP